MTSQVREPNADQGIACVEYVQQNVDFYPAAKAHSHKVGTVTAHQDITSVVGNAWLAVEAIPEKLDLNISTFAELESTAPKDAILASNSSSYKSGEMLEKVQDATKTRILNTHYYMPPSVMTVELITDGYTDPELISFLVERQRDVGTVPYVARRESTGLIFNRLWAAVKREVLTILAEGVSVPSEIDELWVSMFSRGDYGPCQMMDRMLLPL